MTVLANAPAVSVLASRSVAKVSRPRVGRSIARERLFRLLDGWADRSLVWLAGPAGSGKTTLLGTYLEGGRTPVLWYQVDLRDADPATFFHFMSLAVARAAPLAAPMPSFTPEYAVGLQTYSRNFFEWLWAAFAVPPTLVFDNYQEAGDAGPFPELVRDAVLAAPSGGRVIVASRTAPQPPFARLRAERRMAVLAWDDLRLTLQEAGRMADLLGDAPLPAERLAEWHRVTHGWAAGWALALESGLERVPTDAEAVPEAFFDFFAAEVLASMDPETELFLLRTAPLGTMTAAAAERLSGNPAAAEILGRLTRQNFFTVHKPDFGGGYEYHPLFRAFLLARAEKRLGAEAMRQLRREAADCLATEGMAESAVALLREIQDWPSYSTHVMALAPDLLLQGRHRVLGELVGAIPAERRAADPWIDYWSGMAGLPFGDPQARANFAAAHERFVAAGDAAGAYLTWSGVIDTLVLVMDDGATLAGWLAAFDRLRRTFPAFPDPAVECRVLISLLSAQVMTNPWYPDIDDLAARIEHLARAPEAAPLRSTMLFYHTYLHILRGQKEAAQATIGELDRLAQSLGDPPFLRLLAIIVSTVSVNLLDGDWDGTVALADKGLALGAASGVRIFDAALLGQKGWALLNGGRVAEARATLDAMSRDVPRLSAWDMGFVQYLRGIERYLAGDLVGSREATRFALRLLKQAESPPSSAVAHFVLAQVQADLGDAEAFQHSAVVRTFGDHMGNRVTRLHCDLLESYIALVANDEAAALAGLRRGMAHAASQFDQFHMFWKPTNLARLCALAIEHGIEPDTARAAIRRRKLPVPPSHRGLEAWPWPVRIRTFGGLRVFLDGDMITQPRKTAQRPFDLLKAIVAFGSGVREEVLAEALWPESDGDAAHQALATTLHRLRRLVGSEVVLLADRKLSLDPDRCWIDVQALRHLLDGPIAIDLAAEHVAAIAGLYAGEFLANEAETPWLLDARDRLRRKVVRRLDEAARLLLSAGRPEDVEAAYELALEIDPANETIYHAAMDALVRLGRRVEAAALFVRCEAAMRRYHDGEPSPAIRRLAVAAKEG